MSIPCGYNGKKSWLSNNLTDFDLSDVTLTSLTQYARHPGATQSSLLQSARQPASDEKHNTEVEEKKAVPAPKKKRKKKHGITANLSCTRYEVSKYLSSGPFLSVYGAEMPIPPKCYMYQD